MPETTDDLPVAKAYERRALAAEKALINLRRQHADDMEMARIRAEYAESKHKAAWALVLELRAKLEALNV